MSDELKASIRLDPEKRMWTAHCPPCGMKYGCVWSPAVFTWAHLHIRKHERGEIW